jgi:hypothetical protein
VISVRADPWQFKPIRNGARVNDFTRDECGNVITKHRQVFSTCPRGIIFKGLRDHFRIDRRIHLRRGAAPDQNTGTVSTEMLAEGCIERAALGVGRGRDQ